MLVGISGLLLVAVLASLTFYLFTVLAARADLDAARYLPVDTVVYSSVDLVNAAANSHGITVNTFDSDQNARDALRNATGLDWHDDVLPWLGRGLAFAVFPNAAATSSTGAAAAPSVGPGYALLLQSRDDAKARAALDKAAAFQQQHDHPVISHDYNGFTIHVVSPGITSSGANIAPVTAPRTDVAFAAGKGWVVAGGDEATVRAIVDRLNGATGSLAADPTFKDATAGLPANRFGTLYVNSRALARLASASVNLSLTDIFPTAVGYTAWTDAGERTQLTFKAQRPLGIGNLGGDTTGLARLIPADALGYMGVANLGAMVRAIGKVSAQLSASSTSGADLLASGLGIDASDPALQQPAAVALLAGIPGSAIGPTGPRVVLLLRAPDAAALQSAMERVAHAQDWTLGHVQIDGRDAIQIGRSQMPPGAPIAGPADPITTIGYLAVIDGVAVFGSTQADISAVAHTAAGGASLAQSPTFSQLAHQAPTGAALSVYVSVQTLQSLLPSVSSSSSVLVLNPSANATPTPRAAAPVPNALLITQVWNDAQFQTTVDVTFPK